MESLFQLLCQLLSLSPPAACQLSFHRCDGVLALLAIISRKSGPARFAALRALSFASQHQPLNCQQAVDNGAIKLIFALLSHTVSTVQYSTGCTASRRALAHAATRPLSLRSYHLLLLLSCAVLFCAVLLCVVQLKKREAAQQHDMEGST